MFSYPTQIGSIRTRVIQSGTTGPVVVLLHGLSARADRWENNIDSLGGAGIQAMAIDLPGHGFADKGPSFDYSARGYSVWLEQFIQTLGVEKVILIGTSFGGLVAASYAADYPHRVAGLMAVGAIGLVPAGIERRKRTIEWLSEMSRGAIRRRLYRGVLDASLISEDLVEEDYRINNSPGAAAAFGKLAAYYRDGIDDDAAAPRIEALGQLFPTQLIWGRDDPSVSPEYGEQARNIITGSELTYIDDSGHFPYWEKPEVFNDMAKSFICGAFEL